MEIAGFLTYIALLITAYSLLKPHQKLLIRIRLSLLDKIIVPFLYCAIFLALIASEYFKRSDKELTIFKLRMELSFLVSALSFLLLVIITLYVFLKMTINRLRRRKATLFYELAKDLLSKKEYGILIELLDDEYLKLIKYSTKLTCLNRLKSSLLKTFKLKEEISIEPKILQRALEAIEKTGEELKVEPDVPTVKGKIDKYINLIGRNVRHFIGRIIRLFITEIRDKNQEQARHVLHTLLSNSDFVFEMTSINPEVGLKIFNKKIDNYNDYVDEFFYQLIRNRSSLLYYEIRNNENLASESHRYRIPKEHTILSYLFKDAKVAQRLEVYRGIGNYIVDYLRELKEKEVDPYTFGYESFNRDKWRSPAWVGIRFFDIMISEAIYQGIEDHMFLFYFRNFVEQILKNIAYSPEVPEEPEGRTLRTKYTELLDEIVSTLRDWIEIIIADDIKNKEIMKDDYELGNGNILIRGSIMCLVQILDMISRDKRMPSDLKRKYTDRVIGLLFELISAESETVNRYGNVLLNGIKHYMKWPYRRVNKDLYETFSSAFEKFDDIPYTLGTRDDKGRELKKSIKEYLKSLQGQ